MLRDIFSNRDVNCIMSVPVSSTQLNDSWYWSEDKTRDYSVKSGYKVVRNSHNASVPNFSFDWSSCWNLKVHPKIKKFMWCTLSGCLPTMQALVSKRIEVQNL